MNIYPLQGVNPSYATEHARLAPVVKKARELDIATNPDPAAIYEAGSGGFQIWCTPDDNPGGAWRQVAPAMTTAAFSKPCAYVASVCWKWGEGQYEECVIGLTLSTSAYTLGDHTLIGSREIHNRQDDINWARKHIHRLFKLAGVPMPPIYIESL
jgi:hypothetical protein